MRASAWNSVELSFRRDAGRRHTLGVRPTAPRNRRRAISARPFVGVLAVLLGAIISTLDNRIYLLRSRRRSGRRSRRLRRRRVDHHRLHGRPNVDGADLGVARHGVRPRRVLLISAASSGSRISCCRSRPICVSSWRSRSVSGLGSGTFIPLTIGFVVRNLPAWLIVYGVAAYAMNLELSLNIAASIEGWFSDNWSWQWIFWDTALLAPLMLVCIYFGMPRQAVNRALLKTADWAGLLYASLGFSLIYAALDQGNRLDWLNSGLINGLLLGGALLLDRLRRPGTRP